MALSPFPLRGARPERPQPRGSLLLPVALSQAGLLGICSKARPHHTPVCACLSRGLLALLLSPAATSSGLQALCTSLPVSLPASLPVHIPSCILPCVSFCIPSNAHPFLHPFLHLFPRSFPCTPLPTILPLIPPHILAVPLPRLQPAAMGSGLAEAGSGPGALWSPEV